MGWPPLTLHTMKIAALTKLILFPLFSLAVSAGPVAIGGVVINEFQYDDTSTDDREFVELYNSSIEPVDISGWKVGGYDSATTNPSTTIPADTVLNPGAFYVIGNAGVLNLNHTVSANFLENDHEVITLRDDADVLIDAVSYEMNRDAGFITGSTAAPDDAVDIASQVGPGIFGNHQGIDITATPLNVTVSWGRTVDGRDTDNNGRDFTLRPGTPGTTNAPGGTMTEFFLPNPTPIMPGTAMTEMTGSFVPPRVIDPTVAEPNNPNEIPEPHAPGSQAWIAWDPSGGGNCATSQAVFQSKASGFSLLVYLDTSDLPVQFNASNVQFRGSEITLYGIGGGDAFTNLTDLDGSIGLSPGTLPFADTANGFTGIAWIYERVGASPGGAPVSEKRYLVDANDGGDSDFGGNTPLDWVILATYDLSTSASGWYGLSIEIDAAGSGVAVFNGQTTSFDAGELHSGAFNVGYRENLQQGTDGTPDALLRPPTFTFPSAPPAGLTGDLMFTSVTPAAINMSIPAGPGQDIGIEYSGSLASGSWLDIGSVTVAGGIGTFSDTDAARLAAGRGFYRAFLRTAAAE